MENTNKLKIISAFIPCDPLTNPVCTNVTEDDIVELTVIKEYVTTDEGKVYEQEKQIETNRYSRRDYIESFDGETGIQNILKRVGEGLIAQDKFGPDRTGVPAGEADFTRLADVENFSDIVAMADKARSTYDSFDPELKNNMSFEKFIESFKNKDLVDYITKKFGPKQETSKKEEEGK